ncbi:DinB family protein [Micromonospora sp. RP3T]|uniref:DinB family protein n=1 Tax=Micromonospora sp. RP3T TaxID=2135446 RepID=UPI0018EB8728|nr:DinB family protein [Micromonospora sp. RP3T]
MSSDAGAARPARRFGWADMFVAPDKDPRADGPGADERSVLASELGYHRRTLELTCAGLDAEQLARRSVPPSTLSLLGLLRHAAERERHWFRRVMAGKDVSRIWPTGDVDEPFTGAVADPALVAQAWTAWRREVTFAERFVAEAPNLEVRGHRGDRTVSLRELLVHAIGEYARHNGHADLLRERIDGRVGR